MESRSKIRIGIVGAGGTGKSTLARDISSSLGIKCLLSKGITQRILDDDGYDYGSGIQIEKFLSTKERQQKIFSATMSLHGSEPEFVSDRTSLDFVAYGIMEMHDSDTKYLDKMYELCRKEMSRYTHVVFCEFSANTLINNGKRTLNPYYQFIVHSIMKELCEEWKISPIYVPPMGDKERLDFVVSRISSKEG